jgi:hypothetical protein
MARPCVWAEPIAHVSMSSCTKHYIAYVVWLIQPRSHNGVENLGLPRPWVPHISLVFREMWGATVGRPFTTWTDISRSAGVSHLSHTLKYPHKAHKAHTSTRGPTSQPGPVRSTFSIELELWTCGTRGDPLIWTALTFSPSYGIEPVTRLSHTLFGPLGPGNHSFAPDGVSVTRFDACHIQHLG